MLYGTNEGVAVQCGSADRICRYFPSCQWVVTWLFRLLAAETTSHYVATSLTKTRRRPWLLVKFWTNGNSTNPTSTTCFGRLINKRIEWIEAASAKKWDTFSQAHDTKKWTFFVAHCVNNKIQKILSTRFLRNFEKYGKSLVIFRPRKKILWSVSMEKGNNFLDLIFWHACW